MGLEIKKTVRLNVLSLLKFQAGGELPEGESGVTRLKKLGVSQGNAQRTLDEESDLRLATLDQLAKGFRLKPWQLLVPHLDPRALPTLAAGGSSNEPPEVQHAVTDSQGSEDAAGPLFAGLDPDGRALLGDIINTVRRRLAPAEEQMLTRDGSWSKRNSQSRAQEEDPAETVDPRVRPLR
jgi:hypothetical protein